MLTDHQVLQSFLIGVITPLAILFTIATIAQCTDFRYFGWSKILFSASAAVGFWMLLYLIATRF